MMIVLEKSLRMMSRSWYFWFETLSEQNWWLRRYSSELRLLHRQLLLYLDSALWFLLVLVQLHFLPVVH